MRKLRGMTLAETMVSVMILSLMFAAIGAVVGPILSAPAAAFSKTDTVSAAALGLDAIQRDIRQSDVSGIFACSITTSSATCTQPTALSATPPPYIAVVSPYNSAGAYQANGPPASAPNWQGFDVYTKTSTSTYIYRTYVASTTPITSLQSAAQTAVVTASALPSGTTIAVPNAQLISIALNAASSQVLLELVSSSGSGSSANETTYNTSILARN